VTGAVLFGTKYRYVDVLAVVSFCDSWCWCLGEYSTLTKDQAAWEPRAEKPGGLVTNAADEIVCTGQT
jgi:hypothetical protein